MVIPDGKLLLLVDERWPSLRDAGEPSREWNWCEIAEGSQECLALRAKDTEPVAIWSTTRVPLNLEKKTFYRLDFMEVFPPLRRNAIGALTLALVACRAAELGCDGLVLGSFRCQLGFYTSLGGTQRRVRGWNISSKLVPFVFEDESFDELRGHADAVRETSVSGPAKDRCPKSGG